LNRDWEEKKEVIYCKATMGREGEDSKSGRRIKRPMESRRSYGGREGWKLVNRNEIENKNQKTTRARSNENGDWTGDKKRLGWDILS
jgi:hypothetical protein